VGHKGGAQQIGCYSFASVSMEQIGDELRKVAPREGCTSSSDKHIAVLSYRGTTDQEGAIGFLVEWEQLSPPWKLCKLCDIHSACMVILVL
jgi:hypothetical protein